MNLILEFKIRNESERRIEGAARIRLDRRGLTLVEPRTGALKTILVDRIEALCIRSVAGVPSGSLAA